MAPEEEHRRSSKASAGDAVAEACPAFADGCPYAGSTQVLDWLRAKKPAEQKGLCPAFDTGCPFREITNLEGLKHELQKLPASHAGQSKAPAALEKESAAHAALVEMLQAVHKTSQTMKLAVGGDCPVFEQACPFKACLTSSGMPLVMALEIRSWGLMIGESAELAEFGEGLPKAADAGDTAVGDEDGEGLANKLKLGTKEAHTAAENVHFLREFIKGKVPRDIYAKLVVNLYHVYEALEDGLDKCQDHELVDPLYFPDELCRKETLARDAEFFLGADWQQTTAPSEVTKQYVARLREVAEDSPELLIPHAYTRYLGDLSGGQVLKRAAVRGMQLPEDGSGVHFFEFRRIRDMKVFKNMYRARLDGLGVDTSMADEMVVEANIAFDFNTQMFQELDRLMGVDASALPEILAPSPGADGTAAGAGAQLPAAAAACPFAALAAQGVPMPDGHPEFGKAPSKPKAPAAVAPSAKGFDLTDALVAAPAVFAAVVALAGWAYVVYFADSEPIA